MKVITAKRTLIFLFILAAYFCQAKDYYNNARQLLKFTIFPEFYSYRVQFERSPWNYFSFGGSAFYSPNGSWGNYKGSKWMGISPMFRAYAKQERAKGFYLEASLPVTYYNNYPLNYATVKSYQNTSWGSLYSGNYHDWETVHQSFMTIGGGLALGGQFKVYRRLYMDIAFVYEKYSKPKDVKEEIWLQYNTNNGNSYNEKFALDKQWNYFSARIYFGYQLAKDN